jgi:peptidoglycan/LPS O-acetylase OafA/YrhL
MATLKHLQDGPTASRPTYRLVQALRAVAALMVVLHHSTILLADRLHTGVNWVNGGAGVDIFFVISGFVMTISSAPLAATKHPARTFLARRLERILPMYWIVTTLKVLLVLAAPALAINAPGTPWHVLGSYLMFPSYEPVIIAGWTLNFEMAFYLLFAVALAWRVPVLRVAAPALLLAVLLGVTPPTRDRHLVPFYENSMVIEFLFGILLAKSLPTVRRIAWPVALAMAALGFATLILWVDPNYSIGRGVFWGVPALGVVCGAVALEAHIGRSAPAWLLELGDASYSVYLTHGLALPALGIALTHLAPPAAPLSALRHSALLVALVLCCALAGEATYRLVERPITDWFKGRRHTAVPAA